MLPTIIALLAAASFTAAEITVTTYTIETCFTSYDRTSPNATSIPTSLTVSTTHGQGFARGIITPVVTVTPAVSTETTTSVTTSTVSVTAPSDVATGIETVTTTITSSSVISSTETFTSIVSVNSTTTLTATTTIPTLDSFTPVAADIIAQSQVPSRHKNKRWGHLNARNIFDRMLLEFPMAAAPPGRGSGRHGGNKCMFRHSRADPAQETGIKLYPALYPVSVECSQLVREDAVRLYTKKGTVTSTITAKASTTTTTASSTYTTTTTIGSAGSSAASTVTSSTTTVVETTTTSVSTTFSTLTNTFTVNAPVATEYAACAANNTVSLVDGHPIAAGAQQLLVLAEATSPRDCCEMCQMTSGCTTSAYYDGTGDCMLGDDVGTGTNQFFTTADEEDPIFYISNGAGEPSGNWAFGGSLDDPEEPSPSDVSVASGV